MRFTDISVPEVYTDSWDFRFFLRWIWEALTRVKYDTEHLVDVYDPLKCKEELLWMLGDTIGYKYDSRLPASFNRLVILHFMNMIRKKGSKDGVTFAAELNLAQFNLISYGAGYEDENGEVVEGKDILYNRLEDTTVPVNAAYVTPNTAAGYIDVVYFSTEKPVDACIEYVRPLGMYLFQHSGVRFDARTQISIDARLTTINDLYESIGSTHTAHYTRDDYARMQRVDDYATTETHRDDAVISYVASGDEVVDNALHVNTDDTRNPAYFRNSEYNGIDTRVNPGYRALYSLQLCNNEHVMKSLIDPIFSLGYGPQSENQTYSDEPFFITEDNVTVVNPESYLVPPYNNLVPPYTTPKGTPTPTFANYSKDMPPYNLRYDRQQELDITEDVVTLDEDHNPGTKTRPLPAVNPIMGSVGDAISIHDTIHSDVDSAGHKSSKMDE